MSCEESGECTRSITDPITLVGLIFESAQALRRKIVPTIEKETGVTGQAFEVLIRLSRSPGGLLRMSDLAAQTGLTRSGLTRTLDRLVEAKLCLRASCEGDRRGTFAMLTDEGRERITAAISRHEADIERILGGSLTKDEQDQLVALLTKVRNCVHPKATMMTTAPLAHSN